MPIENVLDVAEIAGFYKDDNTSNPVYQVKSFANGNTNASAFVKFLHSQGTKASPTVTGNNNKIFELSSFGRGSSGYDNSSFDILVTSIESFAGTANKGVKAEIKLRGTGDTESKTKIFIEKDKITLGEISGTATIDLIVKALTASSATLTSATLTEPILTKPYIERDSAANSPTGFIYSYGGASYFSYLSARGTKASPTALQSGDPITLLAGAGYGTGGFDTFSGYLALKADENFGDSTHRSAYWNLTIRGPGDSAVQDIGFFDKTTFTFGSARGTGSIAVKMAALTATTGTFGGTVSGVTSLSMSSTLSGGTTATFSGDISSTGGKFGSNNANNYINLVTNGNGEAATRGSWFINVNSNGGNSVPYFGIYFNSSTSNIYFKAEQTGKVTLTNPTTTTSKIVSGVMATVTADKNIASSTTETTLIGTMAGINKTIGASHLLAGKTYRFKLTGYIGNTGTPTIRIKIKLGSTVILDSTAVTMVTITGSQMFKVEGEITCRTTGASGTIIGQADFQYYSTQTTMNRMSIVSTSAVTYDTTAIGAFDITAQWGTNSASNTITSTNFILEEIL